MKPHPIYLKAARGEYLAGKDLAQLIRDAVVEASALLTKAPPHIPVLCW